MKSFETDMLAILPRLKRYARSLSASHADADDLVQDCLEKAFARRETWRGENLQGWLMTILTNLNRNRLRQAIATPHMVDYDAAGARQDRGGAGPAASRPTGGADAGCRRRLRLWRGRDDAGNTPRHGDEPAFARTAHAGGDP